MNEFKLLPTVIARSVSDEAIQSLSSSRQLNCFAEPVVGPRVARTRSLAMTVAIQNLDN